jgi:hypothetical protein
MPSSSGLTFSFEPILDLLVNDRLGDLIKTHWAEIGADKATVPLSVSWLSVLQREAAGNLRVFTARRDGILIGYIGFNFFRPDRHTNTLYIRDETIWVVPSEAHRGLVWRAMWQAAVPMLPRPCKLMAGLTMGRDKRQTRVLAKVLQRLGLRPMEMVMGTYLE